jgi:glycerophosphoryl diester phosphodiesterase
MNFKYFVFTMCIFAGNCSFGQLIVAHRGASFDAPENTLPAFELAWEQGADGIEGDFYLSADGKVVCIHDADTERVAGKKCVVADTDYADLRKLDVGAWKAAQFAGTHIPLFDEVVATVPDGKMFYIELKVGPEIVEPLAEELKKSSLKKDQIIIISFNEETLAACASRLPDLRTHWLSGYKEKNGKLRPLPNKVIASLKQAEADGFGSKAVPEHFNERFLAKIHQAGFNEFHVWTIDEPQTAAFYQRLGAYSITTNRPGWLRQHLDDLSKP